MRGWRTGTLVGAMIGTLFAPGAVTAQGTSDTLAAAGPPRLERLMSPRELRETGVSRLNVRQRAAFDAWLARYTATVATVATMSRQTAPARPPVASPAGMPAGEAAPRPLRPLRLPLEVAVVRGVQRGVRVRQVASDGSAVTLENGTRWEVYMPDRPSSAAWQVGDVVVVREQPAPIAAPTGTYDFTLINGDTGRAVSARIGGRRAAPLGP
jgi:hypothetical protein